MSDTGSPSLSSSMSLSRARSIPLGCTEAWTAVHGLLSRRQSWLYHVERPPPYSRQRTGGVGGAQRATALKPTLCRSAFC